MSPIRLQFKEQIYSFDPEQKNAVVKSRGKFNSVYKGVCENDGKPVLIKKLNENFAGNSTQVERFKREFLLNIKHPHLVQTLAFIEQDGIKFIVREFVAGKDLKIAGRKQRLHPETTVHFSLQILDALGALHDNNIIHCDVRPSNILIGSDQHAKLSDLGLARRISDKGERAPFALIYSPPEQLLNKCSLLAPSGDIYALGITMYELLTGILPFSHSNPELLMNLQLTQPLAPHKKIPPELFRVIQKATVKYMFRRPPHYFSQSEVDEMLRSAQHQRYQTAEEMKKELLAINVTSGQPGFWNRFLSGSHLF